MRIEGLSTCAFIIFALTAAAAAEQLSERATGYTMPLFDGQSLDGWQVTGCEAVVDEGTILLRAGNGLVRTNHRYRDFVLELEWRALRDDKWDSGVFFRCELPEAGKPWPRRYQVNLLKGQEGNVGGLPGAQTKGLVRDGQWNHFRLTVVGTRASLEINGQPAWSVDGVEQPDGYIALQAEVPGGGPFRFRNIRITELGYRSLLDDQLSAWEGVGGDASLCWEVKDGVLIGLEKKGPWLRSREQFDDFNLRLEYKVKPGGNSGVYVRVPESGAHHGAGAGVEVQILDDHHPRYATLKPYQFCGSLYKIAPAVEHVTLPAGRWNQLEIDCRGDRYRVYQNGVLIVDADAERFPELAERLKRGYLGLQNHGGGVWFRRMRIGPPMP